MRDYRVIIALYVAGAFAVIDCLNMLGFSINQVVSVAVILVLGGTALPDNYRKALSLKEKAKQTLMWRNRELSLWPLARQNARRTMIAIGIFCVVIIWLWSAELYPASCVVLGFFGGSLARDLAWFRMQKREWATTHELFDWPKVELLASEADTPST